jgi:hypothetical protein
VLLLAHPQSALTLSPDAWTDVILEARETGLLGRLGARLAQDGLLERLPDAPFRHLDGMARFAVKQHADVMAEVGFIREALSTRGIDVVLMKGAAYVASDSPAAEGRIFEDIDLLVPENRIAEAEAALLAAGWTQPELTAHDARYYYEWMHQIPPMVHSTRGSIVDVHHNIVPRTSGPQVDPQDLLARAQATREPGVYALAPNDLVIHSAVHLLNEGDFTHGLRDLSDLDLLVGRLLENDPQLEQLRRRADELGFGRPLAWALSLIHEVCATPVPTSALAAERGTDRFLLTCFRWALLQHASVKTGMASAALYIRGHLLKMPIHILIPHLTKKALRPKPSAKN